MKTSLSILLSVAFAGTLAGTSSAAIVSSGSSASYPIYQTSIADQLYDYAVYAAEPRFRWFIVWDMGGGNTIEYGSFITENSANDFLAQCFFHGWEPAGYVGYEIVQREVEPVFEYVTTYDKKSDAIALANALQNLGLYTEIRTLGLYRRLTR